jgi:hypothetical protein
MRLFGRMPNCVLQTRIKFPFISGLTRQFLHFSKRAGRGIKQGSTASWSNMSNGAKATYAQDLEPVNPAINSFQPGRYLLILKISTAVSRALLCISSTKTLTARVLSCA